MCKNTVTRGQNENRPSIKITSLNIRGLRNEIKRNRVLRHLKDNYPGILFLQETYTVEGDEKWWKCNWKGEFFMSHGTNHSKGVAILIPDSIQTEIKKIEIDPKGRYVIVNGKFGGRELTLLNCYAPTKNNSAKQLSFLDELLPKINEYYENLVLGGDFNTYLDPQPGMGT
jgi:exonuclease III